MKAKAPHADVLRIAESVVSFIESDCTRVEIAGSLRRKKEMVGDIEIVAIPLPERDLFGDPTGMTLLDINLAGLVKTKDGPKYKQFTWDGVQVDLFLATPDNWGLILMLRTGDADFSHKMVMPCQQGGWMPNGIAVRDGSVWAFDQRRLPVPEEADLFRLWRKDYVSPENRFV